MEDFRRKARLVAGGRMTKAPATITYASVFSRETVRITLLMAALNDLNVKVGDVLNAYIVRHDDAATQTTRTRCRRQLCDADNGR